MTGLRGRGLVSLIDEAASDLQTQALIGCGECESCNCPRCYLLFARVAGWWIRRLGDRARGVPDDIGDGRPEVR